MGEQGQLLPMSQGENLQHHRRRLGYTRGDVASRLRCDESVIAALEEGRDPGLAPVYLQGFLRAYARLLELPPEQAAELIGATTVPAPELQSVFPSAPARQASDRWLRAASYVLASLLVGTLAWQVSHEVVRLTQDEQEAVASGAPVNASIASLETLVGERGHPGGAEAWAALDRARQGEALAPGEHLLELSASADSWVEIIDHQGELLEQDLVRGGSQRSYRGVGPFRITFGRTSAIELNVDGRPVQLAANRDDDVTQMTLDPELLPPSPDLPPAPQ